MSEIIASAPPSASTAELQSLLQAYLDEHDVRRIVQLSRRPSEYRSSFNLEEIDARLDDGRTLPLVWKQTGRRSLNAEAIDAKPEFLYDPLREIEIYRRFRALRDLGTPECFGAIVDGNRDLYGVLLERVSGLNLSFIGEMSIWQEAARWLARLHDRFVPIATSASPIQFFNYDRQIFKVWIARAIDFLKRAHPPRSRVDIARMAQLAEAYDMIIDRLAKLPKSLIHGDFFASNVIVDERRSPPRICAVDWELAGIGPRGLDLAALVAGNWSEDERDSILLAYYQAATQGASIADFGSFKVGIGLCRLHLAIQMLGWSATWRPQPQHFHDWLADAINLSDQFGLV